jgi:menaquinone-dependent protoporphyrinogen oxidase
VNTNSVLIAFSSRHGATEGLARMIGKTIAEHGLTVDVRRMDDVDTVYPYAGLVLGSAVYMGRWTAEARQFVDLHQEAIVARPTWLFSSGPIGDDIGLAPFDADELVVRTGALDHHLFGGRLQKRSLGLSERAVTRLLGAQEGDYRDWPSAAAWATAIARSIADERVASRS